MTRTPDPPDAARPPAPAWRRFCTLLLVLVGALGILVAAAGYVLRRPPGDLQTVLGHQRLEDELPVQAMEYFEAVLQLDPAHRGARMGRALVFLRTERPQAARSELDGLIDELRVIHGPGNEPQVAAGRAALAVAYANRGMANDRMGFYRLALSDYLYALAADPRAVSGPGTVYRVLHGSRHLSTVRERARYLHDQLQLPEQQRVLRIPELDARQPMHKP